MYVCIYMYIANSKQTLNVIEINNTWLGFHNNNFLMKNFWAFFFILSQQFFLKSPLASYKRE